MLVERGEVTMVEEHVRTRIYSLKLSDGFEIRAYTSKHFELGERVDVMIRHDKLYIFDGETMSRLS